MRIFYKRLFGGKCVEGLGEDGCTGEYVGSDIEHPDITRWERFRAYNKVFGEFARVACCSVPFAGMDYADIVGQGLHPDAKSVEELYGKS